MNSSLNQSTKYSSLNRKRMMASAISHDTSWIIRQPTGNPVYDGVALYCDYIKMNIAGLETVKETFGENFTCRQVARASHITARRITLSKNWETITSYPFLAFYGEDEHPVLCVPKGFHSFDIYDPTENVKFKVTKQNKAMFSDEGLIFCRPLPRRSLSFKDILSYGKHYISRIDVFNMCFMILLSTLVGLLLPVLNEQLFDKLIPMGSMNAIMQVGGVILSCSIGNIFFLLVKNLSSLRAISLAKYAIMDATFERIYNLPQSFIEKFGSVDLVTRAMGMMETLISASTSVMTVVISAFLSVIYLIRMHIKSAKLTKASLIMLAIGVAVSLILGFAQKKYVVESEKENCTATNSLYGFISGILKVRLSSMEDKAVYDYQTHNIRVIRNNIKCRELSVYSEAFTVIMSAIYTVVIYFLILRKGMDISLGKLTGFTAAFGLFNSAVMQLVSLIVQIPQIKPSIDRAMPIYETACENTGVGNVITRYKGRIEVSNVSFRYDKEENNVLNEISFNVEPGEYIGIVGSSGCGKSTLFKLLLGFEKPTSGSIYYDDLDMETLDKTELRRQMGVVLQDGRLTSGTIYENIALSAPGIKEEKVKRLLYEAGMGPDLDRMPMGILTEVSEFGGSISGGQQQRILIARALANDPCILLFDEATSALDNGAQSILCDTLARRNITRIVIAHRLNTVEKCDRIYVMDKGRIVETGTYTELSEAGGLFSEMIKLQKIKTEEDRQEAAE